MSKYNALRGKMLKGVLAFVFILTDHHIEFFGKFKNEEPLQKVIASLCVKEGLTN